MDEQRGSLTVAELAAVRFGRPQLGRRGYNKGDVDAFLQRVALRLERRESLTAAEIRQVAFRLPPMGRRGHNEDQVDELLDRAEATVAAMENLGR